MRMNMRYGKLGFIAIAGLIVAAGAILAASPALAIPITYTMTDTGTGSLNGSPFTDASILLKMINDTTNIITAGPSLFHNAGTSTVSVNGGAPVTFTDTTHVFSNQPFSAVGFNDQTHHTDILVENSSSFATYALAAIGPITDSARIGNAGFNFPTTGGDFILNSVGDTATFTATAAAAPVPEPGSLALFSVALAGLGFLFRRSRTATTS
jgi:hypothetical protein